MCQKEKKSCNAPRDMKVSQEIVWSNQDLVCRMRRHITISYGQCMLLKVFLTLSNAPTVGV